MSESLVEVSTRDGAVRFVAEHGAELFEGAECLVSIVRPSDPTTLVVAAGAGGEWAQGLIGTEWPVEGTLHGRALLSVQAVETTNETTATAAPGITAGEVKTGRLVPLRTGDPLPDRRDALGVIAFWRVGRHSFSEDDRQLIDLFGSLASVIVHRAELVHEAEAVTQRMEATEQEVELLQQAAESLSGTLELDRIFQQTVLSAARIMTPPGGTARRSALLVVSDHKARVVAEHDERGARIGPLQYAIADHAQIRRVVEQRETVASTVDEPGIDDGSLVDMRSLGVTWSAMAPIVSGDQVVAILRVSSYDNDPFTDEHRARLDAIANVTAMAIGNAERYSMARSEAQRLAELENIKSEFLRLASHELRGPLALVRGYLSMFEDGSLPTVAGAARDVLPVVSARLTQMSRLIDDMLETARLEDRRLQLAVRHVDLRDVVHHAVEDIPVVTGVHSIQVEICAEPLPVVADPGRITTIVRNLVDNAIRYSPAGGRIRITAERDSDTAVVAVADEGIGIAADDQHRLFERFGRIVTSENSHISGTGLGLHLSRELARLHNGDITVESEEGHGSTFRLRLPLSAG